MRRFRELLSTLLLGAVLGCGGGGVKLEPATPITIDEWKQLPYEQKYNAAYLDRLRMSDPNLAADEAWDAYVQKVVIPARQRDNRMKPKGL